MKRGVQEYPIHAAALMKPAWRDRQLRHKLFQTFNFLRDIYGLIGPYTLAGLTLAALALLAIMQAGA